MPTPSGGWFVISVQTSARGTSEVKVSQKPFPVGATEVSGPYATKAEAQAAAKKTGQGITIPLPHFPNPLSGLSSLFQANIWIRVAEVVLGLVLVAVGLAKMTNAVPIATKIAKVAA